MDLKKNDGLITTYVRGNPTDDPANVPQFLTNELRRLELTVSQLSNLVPQVSTKAPMLPLTGMIRFNKAPWNPLGTGDGWIRFNGTAWVVL